MTFFGIELVRPRPHGIALVLITAGCLWLFLDSLTGANETLEMRGAYLLACLVGGFSAEVGISIFKGWRHCAALTVLSLATLSVYQIVLSLL